MDMGFYLLLRAFNFCMIAEKLKYVVDFEVVSQIWMVDSIEFD